MNMRIVDDISQFIFVEDQLVKSDVILIPGGSYVELPERAAEIWKAGYAPLVIPSGGVSIKSGKFNGVKSKQEKYAKEYKTECEFYTDVLELSCVPIECIIGEDKSACTADNARFSKKLLDEKGIYPQTAIICCKAFHARRCLMFYQFYFPETQFIVSPIAHLANDFISKDNWYKSEIGISRVLGELSRLGNQFTSHFHDLRGHFPEYMD